MISLPQELLIENGLVKHLLNWAWDQELQWIVMKAHSKIVAGPNPAKLQIEHPNLTLQLDCLLQSIWTGPQIQQTWDSHFPEQVDPEFALSFLISIRPAQEKGLTLTWRVL
jgi:hypothetical protein